MTDAPRLISLGDPDAIACEGEVCEIPTRVSGTIVE